MVRQQILVVDDEEDILELVRYNLTKENFQVTCATSGEQALELSKKEKPDLVLLDLMLPGLSGLDVCRKMKTEGELDGVPIIMVSAKGEEADVVTGLELGADDYITKPFSPRVLLARVRTVLRRLQARANGDDTVVSIHELAINLPKHEVRLGGKVLDLTAHEFKLLHFLAQRPGWVFTRGQIVEGIHGDDYPVTDRSVDVQVVGLRKKLGDSGTYIETVRGVGYRFREL